MGHNWSKTELNHLESEAQKMCQFMLKDPNSVSCQERAFQRQCEGGAVGCLISLCLILFPVEYHGEISSIASLPNWTKSRDFGQQFSPGNLVSARQPLGMCVRLYLYLWGSGSFGNLDGRWGPTCYQFPSLQQVFFVSWFTFLIIDLTSLRLWGPRH